MLGGSCRGQPLREPTPTYWSKMPTFFLVWLVWERQIVWVLGPETINEFQAISGSLKHFEATCWLAGLPVLQCMCPVLRNGVQIRDVWSWSISISFFFGRWSRWVRFPDLTDSQLCWLEAEPSNVRAERSFLEDEGVLMDRTARETAWFESSSQALWHVPGHPRLNLFIETFLERAWGVLTIRLTNMTKRSCPQNSEVQNNEGEEIRLQKENAHIKS